ncbi:CPBP family glutamic-type intramembrane protease [Microbacterium hominis]|nr:CPBP family glutamic-type intramembrane protease [Microbacterium hominis]
MAAFINLVPALGEELGWRGWLLPKLMPLGAIPAILISGVIWGLWHAPLILLGYNYPGVPGWLGLTAMTEMCIVFGAIFGWLRLRSDSVWPAALAHAAFNGAGGTYLLFAMAGERIDTTQATVLGWSGWIVPLALVIVLVASDRFRRPSPAPLPDERSTTRAAAEASSRRRRAGDERQPTHHHRSPRPHRDEASIHVERQSERQEHGERVRIEEHSPREFWARERQMEAKFSDAEHASRAPWHPDAGQGTRDAAEEGFERSLPRDRVVFDDARRPHDDPLPRTPREHSAGERIGDDGDDSVVFRPPHRTGENSRLLVVIDHEGVSIRRRSL